MDLRVYYQKIRDAEAKITEDFPVVVSIESADGGKEGVKTEVTRQTAAKLLVEGIARLASPEQVAEFRAAVTEAKRVADRVAEAAKLRLTILSTTEMESLRGAAQGTKE
jgi:hypothetical protein